ncbi:MAG: hemerythrin family protein [Lachnospiraceae bacterium]|nr:hemerythrin family protein [Lachnospiraceae bacterium]
MFEFSEDYRVGIELIDKEHEGLFNLLNSAILSLEQRRAQPREIAADFLENLKIYAAEHFAHEEAYMKKINDVELPRQQEEHANFTGALEHFYADEHTKENDVRDLINYVVKWLFGHILTSDMMIGKIRRVRSKKDLAFTKEYMSYIDFMDEEHSVLFDIIREANDLIIHSTTSDKYDAIIEIMNKLKNYTEGHFQHEEEYMEKIGYPKLEVQKVAHSAFIEKLGHLDLAQMQEIDENPMQYLSNIIDYLLNWLTTHIQYMDLQIAEWEMRK